MTSCQPSSLAAFLMLITQWIFKSHQLHKPSLSDRNDISNVFIYYMNMANMKLTWCLKCIVNPYASTDLFEYVQYWHLIRHELFDYLCCLKFYRSLSSSLPPKKKNKTKTKQKTQKPKKTWPEIKPLCFMSDLHNILSIRSIGFENRLNENLAYFKGLFWEVLV